MHYRLFEKQKFIFELNRHFWAGAIIGRFSCHAILDLKSSIDKYCPSNLVCNILWQLAQTKARSAKVVSLTPVVDIGVMW